MTDVLHYSVEVRDGTWTRYDGVSIHSSLGGCSFRRQTQVDREATRWARRWEVEAPWTGRRVERGHSSHAMQSSPIHPAQQWSFWNDLGFDLRRRASDIPDHKLNGWGVVLPYWFLVALTGSVPAVLLARRHRSRRRDKRLRRGECPRCGYDLRATPGRCPECGVVEPGLVP